MNQNAEAVELLANLPDVDEAMRWLRSTGRLAALADVLHKARGSL
jgi:hypothetical protein